MKKNIIMNINLAISLIIVSGFFCMAILNYNTYSQVIDDDIKNITKLTSTNIYSEINNELTKPIFVSLTMANDSFLKNWLSGEERVSNDKAYRKKLQDYLIGIRSKYEYNSVFVVSEKTKNYYHFDGILKTVNKKNAHDQWYYNFVDSKAVYDLDVDQDEASQNTLTVFVNCRVEDSDGSLMAVVGVGVQIDKLQSLLKQFEDSFSLDAFLADESGLVQIHTNLSKIEKENIFDKPAIARLKNKIINDRDNLVISRFKKENLNGYLITRYINEMDWFLIVKKDTSILNRSFHTQLIRDMIVLLLILFLLLSLSTYCISKYNKHITKLTLTDELTSLPNRRDFNNELNKAIVQYKENNRIFQVFIFDIDFFKMVNDTYGHLFGDSVIVNISVLADQEIGSKGMVSRWGGDEFAGIILGSEKEAAHITGRLMEMIRNSAALQKHITTISLGMTQIRENDTIDSILIRADSALYQAKSEGRNRIIQI